VTAENIAVAVVSYLGAGPRVAGVVVTGSTEPVGGNIVSAVVTAVDISTVGLASVVPRPRALVALVVIAEDVAAPAAGLVTAVCEDSAASAVTSPSVVSGVVATGVNTAVRVETDFKSVVTGTPRAVSPSFGTETEVEVDPSVVVGISDSDAKSVLLKNRYGHSGKLLNLYLCTIMPKHPEKIQKTKTCNNHGVPQTKTPLSRALLTKKLCKSEKL